MNHPGKAYTIYCNAADSEETAVSEQCVTTSSTIELSNTTNDFEYYNMPSTSRTSD